MSKKNGAWSHNKGTVLHTSINHRPLDVSNTGQCLGILNFIENEKFGRFFSSKLNLSRQCFHAQEFEGSSFWDEQPNVKMGPEFVMLNLFFNRNIWSVLCPTFVLHSISLNNESWTIRSPSRPALTSSLVQFGAREVMRQSCQWMSDVRKGEMA